MALFNKKSTTLKTESESALAAARALADVESRFTIAMANVAELRVRIDHMTGLPGGLRDKAAKLTLDADFDQAAKLSEPIASTKAALEHAMETLAMYESGGMAQIEDDLDAAIAVAERHHPQYHRAAEDAMRQELVDLLRSRFVAAWRHSMAGGNVIDFDLWMDGLMGDANVRRTDGLRLDVDLGMAEQSPTPSCLGFIALRQLRGRAADRRIAREEQENMRRHREEIAAGNAARREAEAKRDADNLARLEATNT